MHIKKSDENNTVRRYHADSENLAMAPLIHCIVVHLGGRAIFIEIASIHISEVIGAVINRPFVSIMFRV